MSFDKRENISYFMYRFLCAFKNTPNVMKSAYAYVHIIQIPCYNISVITLKIQSLYFSADIKLKKI